jgi:hypothetical protein
MTDEEKEFAFFNKALKEKNIYHLGLNQGQHVPVKSRTLTSVEIEEEKIWGKENRNIKEGRIRVIRTSNLHSNVDAIRKIIHGKSRETLTLVELQGIAEKELADPIVRAIADILPHTTILCLNLGEMQISDVALKYLLEKIQDEKCILGALFIEIAEKQKKKFIDALAVNRKKIDFLYRISNEIRYSYLKNYGGAWWNLRSRPITEWFSRFEKLQYKIAKETGTMFEDGLYFAVLDEDEDEDEDEDANEDEAGPERKKKK